jgi:hypothetical protein
MQWIGSARDLTSSAQVHSARVQNVDAPPLQLRECFEVRVRAWSRTTDESIARIAGNFAHGNMLAVEWRDRKMGQHDGRAGPFSEGPKCRRPSYSASEVI